MDFKFLWANVFALSLSILSQFARADVAQDGAELRKFIADVVKISAEPEALRVGSLRTYLGNNSDKLILFAKSPDPEALYQSTGLPEPKVPQNATFGHSPQASKTFFLDTYKNFQTQFLPYLKMLEATPLSARGQILQFVDDRHLSAVLQKLDSEIRNLKMSEVPAVNKLMGPDTMKAAGNLPPDKAEKLQQILLGYFDHLPLASKRKVIGAYLNLPARAPLQKQIGAILHNSGPALQKLFQQIGKGNPDPVMKEVMHELLSNIKPFPGQEAKRIFESSTGKKVDEVFLKFDDQPLKAASVGQIHEAQAKDGSRVAVKILRPEIRDRAREEVEALRKSAGNDPFFQAYIDKLEEALMEELDFTSEASNIIKGRKYIDPRKGITIADLAGNIPATQDVMVLHFADGKVMADVKAADLVKKGQALANFYEKWMNRAMFDDGFFHADLHPGNLFYRELPGQKPPFKITAIDFGSVGNLSAAQRQGIMKFGMALMAESPGDAAHALSEIAKMDQAAIDRYANELTKLFKQQPDTAGRIKLAINRAIDQGIEMDRALLQFYRGDDFITSAIHGVNKELDAVDPLKKLPRYNPIAIAQKVAAHRIGIDLLSQAKEDLGSRLGFNKSKPLGIEGIDETHYIPASYLRDFARRNISKAPRLLMKRVCRGTVLERLTRLQTSQ